VHELEPRELVDVAGRARDDEAGREIVAGLNAAIPGMRLWRYSLEPSPHRRYEEQDLGLLLRDLDRAAAS